MLLQHVEFSTLQTTWFIISLIHFYYEMNVVDIIRHLIQELFVVPLYILADGFGGIVSIKRNIMFTPVGYWYVVRGSAVVPMRSASDADAIMADIAR